MFFKRQNYVLTSISEIISENFCHDDNDDNQNKISLIEEVWLFSVPARGILIIVKTFFFFFKIDSFQQNRVRDIP